jgi:hypothetical protein
LRFAGLRAGPGTDVNPVAHFDGDIDDRARYGDSHIDDRARYSDSHIHDRARHSDSHIDDYARDGDGNTGFGFAGRLRRAERSTRLTNVDAGCRGRGSAASYRAATGRAR